MDEEQRALLIRSFPHYSSSTGLALHYGEHGFVGDESVLRSAAYRIGILAALRSMKSKSVTGVMITACGRCAEMNAVRIVDPDGGALIEVWEPLADSVANAADPDEFVMLIEECMKKENISFDGGQPAEVLLARDTSPSGEALLEAAKQGMSSITGTIYHDMGILTTPQLHWLVHARNKGRKASEHDYLQHLSFSYRCLIDLIPERATADNIGESLVVDGANGVGGDKIEALKDLCDGLTIEIRNTSNSGAVLDQGVGVEFIQEQKIIPSGFGSGDLGFRCASLDGDADRLRYFFVLPSQEIEIVDGDKILVLFTLFINEQLAVLQEAESEEENGHYPARLGILRSGYGIGPSANYLKSLGLDIVSFPPGTRSLHAVASKYDIAICFEADGHGGILFSENYLSWLEAKNNELLSSSKGSRKQLTVSRLLAVSRLMSTTVSDALASLLLVEAILQHNGWSLQKWNEIYSDLVNMQLNEEKHESQILNLHSDETANENKLEASVEEEAPDNCVKKSFVEQRKREFNIELEMVQEPHVGGVEESCPANVLEEAEYHDHAIDKEGTEIKREEGDDDAWVLVSDGTEDCMDAGPITTETKEYNHLPELDEPVNEKESFSSPKVNGIRAPVENVDDLLLSADTDEAEGINSPEFACDTQTQSQTNSDLHLPDSRDYEPLLELDEPLDDKESCSTPKISDKHAVVENVDDLHFSVDTDKAEEAGVLSGLESACDAQPQSQTGSGVLLAELDEPPLNEKESCSSPKINSIRPPDETHTAEEAEVVSGLESSCDAQLQSQPSNGIHLPDSRDYEHLPESDDPLNGKESCSSPKVNGMHAPFENVNDLLVSADTDEAEDAGDISGPESESACDSQPQSQVGSGDRVPSVIVHDEQLGTKAQNGPVDVDNGSSCLVNGMNLNAVRVSSCLDGNDSSVSMESGEASPILSDASNTEETGVLNVVEYASCNIAPSQGNGIVITLPPFEHVAKVEPISENSPADIDNDSNYPVNSKSSDMTINFSSSEVNSVEASVETLKNLPIPTDLDDTEEAGATNGDLAIKPPSHIQCSISSSLVHDSKLDSEAENCAIDVENGLDVNLPVGKADDLSSPKDVNQAQRSADGAGTAKHDSEANGGSSGLPIVQAAEPEVETENNPAEVENESESTIDNIEGTYRPCLNKTSETEVANEFESVQDIQPPSQNCAIGVENGLDVNLPVEKADDLSSPNDVNQAQRSADGAGTAKNDSEANGGSSGLPTVQVAEPEVETENSPAEVENKSESTIDNIEGAYGPCLNKTAETEVTNEFESVHDIQPPYQINDSGATLNASAYHGEVENQAESNLLVDAQEKEAINVADGAVPQVEVSHQGTCLESKAENTPPGGDILHLESKAENTPPGGDISSDCLIGSVSLNTSIRFGSLEFAGNACPKSEAPIAGSRDVDHSDSDSSYLGKNEAVIETFDEINGQQHVADNHCDHKVEETHFKGSGDFPSDDLAMSAVINTEGDINEGIGINGIVCAVETNLDKESTSSVEESATAVVDGESTGDEIVKTPFYYLIRIPKYDDEKLSERIRSAEMLLEERTRNRDAVLTEYRGKKEACQKLRANQQNAILEERAARDLVRAKRKEIDSAQSLVNAAKDAMTIEDLDNKIANMEHTIQHETVSLNEEKKLIREIKQSTQLREQLLAGTKKQGVQQALDHRDKNEDRLKVLRKEMDALKNQLYGAEQTVKAAMKILDSEHAILNELQRRLKFSNDARQEAYSNLQNLRSQWSEKNKYFWSCKNVQRQANIYAASGDKTSLQSVCVDQVESVMKLWNSDNDFRKDYIRCNLRSTLRRLGTSDGRSLGPDEEAPSLPVPPVRRLHTTVKGSQGSRAPAPQPAPVAVSQNADTRSAKKVVEQKKPTVVTSKPKKASSLNNEEAEASNAVEIEEEDKEILKARKEQEELARRAEELRKAEEAERLKEIRRLEEKAKFQEALERKRTKAEKAQAKAELRAKREAEEKEKEREKRARKKQNKKKPTSDDTNSNPDSEVATNLDAQSEQQLKVAETSEKSVAVTKKARKPQYTKQKKLKTILPPPPPLRNRGSRRRTQQWVWVAVTIVAILILFFLGNLNLPEITGLFSSWH